jgi:hypothetical protein
MRVALAAIPLLILAACGYGPVVTRQTPGPEIKCADARYGTLRFTLIRQLRKPKGINTFPDGGKSRDLAWYASVRQIGSGFEREIARIDLKPIRAHDYGDLIEIRTDWVAPDRLAYRIRNGYLPPRVETTEGELRLQPVR